MVVIIRLLEVRLQSRPDTRFGAAEAAPPNMLNRCICFYLRACRVICG